MPNLKAKARVIAISIPASSTWKRDKRCLQAACDFSIDCYKEVILHAGALIALNVGAGTVGRPDSCSLLIVACDIDDVPDDHGKTCRFVECGCVCVL